MDIAVALCCCRRDRGLRQPPRRRERGASDGPQVGLLPVPHRLLICIASAGDRRRRRCALAQARRRGVRRAGATLKLGADDADADARLRGLRRSTSASTSRRRSTSRVFMVWQGKYSWLTTHRRSACWCTVALVPACSKSGSWCRCPRAPLESAALPGLLSVPAARRRTATVLEEFRGRNQHSVAGLRGRADAGTTCCSC